MIGKNLKANPEMLMDLRRRCAVESFIIELAYDPAVTEISIEWRKNNMTIICNGTTKVFKISEPLFNIKKEVAKCING